MKPLYLQNMTIDISPLLQWAGPAAVTAAVVYFLNKKRSRVETDREEVAMIKDLMAIANENLMKYKTDFDYLKGVNMEVLQQNTLLIQDNQRLTTNLQQQDATIKQFRQDNKILTQKFEELQRNLEEYQKPRT